MSLTQTLLLLTVASFIATIFADQLPGTWWQWALATVILFLAAGVSEVSDDGEGG